MQLFSDEKLIKLPFCFKFLQKLLAVLLVKLHWKKSQKIYEHIEKIHGKDFTKKIIFEIAHKLSEKTNIKTLVHFRYSSVDFKLPLEYSEILVLPLYAQYSDTTTGSSFCKITEILGNSENISFLQLVPTSPPIIDFWKTKILEKLKELLSNGHSKENIKLIFSAHSLPESYIKDGDIYLSELTETFNELKQFFSGDYSCTLAFQSKFGKGKWLEPSIIKIINSFESHSNQKTQILVIPISFLFDQVETLYELDYEIKNLCEEKNIDFHRIQCPNASEELINSLILSLMSSLQ